MIDTIALHQTILGVLEDIAQPVEGTDSWKLKKTEKTLFDL